MRHSPIGALTEHFRVELEVESNGRFLAEVVELPGCLAYGNSTQDAVAKALLLASLIVSDRSVHGDLDGPSTQT
jgi:predicted RNase H-like HicB family nuclease